MTTYTANDVINCVETAASRRLGFSVKLIVGQWQNVPSWATWHEKYDGGGEFVGVLVKEQDIDKNLGLPLEWSRFAGGAENSTRRK